MSILSRLSIHGFRAALAAVAVSAAASSALAADPIRIGEINSYTGLPAFTIPYRQGWELAVAEVNAAGGLLGGRRLEVVSRDDGGKPEDAVRTANELIANEKVALLTGTYFSHIGLAVADVAARNKVMFLAAEPLTDAIIWAKGNPYTFRLRPGTAMQAGMLVDEAARLPARRWATVAPNYEYGQAAVAAFKEKLRARRPDVEFVTEQWPAQGKIDAGATVQALAAARPDAIFNVTFGPDLAKFVREGTVRGLFDDRPVVSLLTGEPEYLVPLKDEAPEGWIVTGYPWEQVTTPEHDAFLAAYRARYDDFPRLGSVVGYTAVKTIAAAIARAGSTDTPALLAAMKGLEVESPFGPITFRAGDHQATMGAFVGTTVVKDGQGTMTGWRYADGAAYLPPEDEAARLRPAE